MLHYTTQKYIHYQNEIKDKPSMCRGILKSQNIAFTLAADCHQLHTYCSCNVMCIPQPSSAPSASLYNLSSSPRHTTTCHRPFVSCVKCLSE